MDPFELLKKDHQTVSKLFERIESVSGKAKLGVFQQIKNELELHTHIEETIFYPALEKANETRDLTLEAYEEHKVVKDMLTELDTANSVSDEWEAKLKVLRENVEHHVDEEENELFDKANDVLTGEEADRLGERMRAEKVKRGGSAPEPEKPGLLQKIATTLGIGTAAQKAKKAPARKKPAKAAKKAGRKPAKAGATKSARSSKSTARGSKTRASKTAGATSRSAASSKGSVKKGTPRRKKGAVKKARRGR